MRNGRLHNIKDRDVFTYKGKEYIKGKRCGERHVYVYSATSGDRSIMGVFNKITYQMKHELKTWPEYFSAILEGSKNFEVRQNDRNFQVGDVLVLREYDPEAKRYTARVTDRLITYVLDGDRCQGFGIKPGFCVMGIKPIPERVYYEIHNQE